MCFGSTITCDTCHLATTYLLAGIHRCSNLNTLTHKITGPTTTASTCWQCRATATTMADPRSEASTMISWYENTQRLFSVKYALWEAKEIASELELEVDSATDEAAKAELEQLKKAADERVKELKAVEVKHRAWATGDPWAAFIVSVPPRVGDRAPLTFQAWSARFGDRSVGTRESVEWTRLKLDCEKYEEYLEDNRFEFECDQFHAKAAEEYARDRRVFHFDEFKEGKLDLHAWRRKERLGTIKIYQQSLKSKNLTSRSNAEIFESTLDLYWLYLAETPEDACFLHWRRGSAKLRRYRLYGLKELSPAEAEAQIAATPAPKMADEDEIPMTFAGWCASTLADADPEVNRNTDSALRDDLIGYQNYLFRFPESAPIHEKHSSELQRLQNAYRDDFSSRESNFVAQGTNSQPLSLKDFSQNLEEQGYSRIRLSQGWTSEAYRLYLWHIADVAEANGFAMSRDWWARGDRRELEGLPRWDPVSTKLKSVMEWLARLISSAEQKLLEYEMPQPARLQRFLSPHLLMLHACLDRSREPTADQWRSMRHDVRITEKMIEDLDAVEDSESDSDSDDSDREGRPHDHEDHRRLVPRVRHLHGRASPFIRLSDLPDQGSDNESEAEGDDFDRLFDEDHQTVNDPVIPSQNLDDENSSENGREVGEPFSLFEMRDALQALAEDAEDTDEED